MEKSMVQRKVAELPQNPGVYFFWGAAQSASGGQLKRGKILYIGKATNLRSRVQSYFRNVIPNLFRNLEEPGEMLKQVQHDKGEVVEVAGRSEWIGRMIAQVEDIDFQETDSVLEALILESNLIKKHQPKYNTQEKDDKSFSYFVITKEEFPRVIILRKTDLKKYVIPNLFRDLEEPGGMLKQVQHDKEKKAKKLMPEKLQTIYGPYTSKHQMQVALKIIRRIFPFHALKQKTEKGCLDFQIGMCPGPYANAITKDDYAKNIRAIKMILEGKKKRLVSTLEKEMTAFAKKNEFEKAAELRNKIFALNHIRDVALMTREFESVPSPQPSPRGRGSSMEENFRIEAYDISNISGQHAVGSMVVFSAKGGSASGGESYQPNKSQYRKFKIKTVEGSNDVAMMKEMLIRRFVNHLTRPEYRAPSPFKGEGKKEKTSKDWAMPDLIVLDGGQGHVNMATKLLREELGLSVEIFGVAKGPTRKKLEIIKSKEKTSSEIQKILNDKNLIKQITDEAHRFAITFHRKLRSKNAF